MAASPPDCRVDPPEDYFTTARLGVHALQRLAFDMVVLIDTHGGVDSGDGSLGSVKRVVDWIKMVALHEFPDPWDYRRRILRDANLLTALGETMMRPAGRPKKVTEMADFLLVIAGWLRDDFE